MSVFLPPEHDLRIVNEISKIASGILRCRKQTLARIGTSRLHLILKKYSGRWLDSRSRFLCQVTSSASANKINRCWGNVICTCRRIDNIARAVLQKKRRTVYVFNSSTKNITGGFLMNLYELRYTIIEEKV